MRHCTKTLHLPKPIIQKMNDSFGKFYCYLKMKFQLFSFHFRNFWKDLKFLCIPVLLIGTLWLLFRIWKIPFLPDILNLSNLEKETFSNVFSALAAMSGIVIAVLLLSFEQFKNKLGESAIPFFISNKWLHLLVSTQISSIIICFISLLLLPNKLNYEISDLNILYFCSFAFIGNIVFIFFASYKLIKTLSTDYIIKESILKVEEVIYETDLKISGDENFLNSVHANPFYVLLNLIKAGFSNLEFFTVATTVNRFTKKMNLSIMENPERIKEEYQCQMLMQNIDVFFSTTFDIGKKINATHFGRTFSDNIKKIYGTCLKIKVPVNWLSSFRAGILKKSFEDAIKSENEDEILIHTGTIFFILKKALENNSPEDYKISLLKGFFTDKMNHEEKLLFEKNEDYSAYSAEWNEVSEDFPLFISRYGEDIIQKRKTNLYIRFKQSIIWNFSNLMTIKTSKYKSAFVRWKIITDLFYNNYLALKTDLYNREFHRFHIDLFPNELLVTMFSVLIPELSFIIEYYLDIVKSCMKAKIDLDWFLGSETGYYIAGGELHQLINSIMIHYNANPECQQFLTYITKFIRETIEIINNGGLTHYPELKKALIENYKLIQKFADDYKITLPNDINTL